MVCVCMPVDPGTAAVLLQDAHAALFPIDYDDAFFHRATNAVDRCERTRFSMPSRILLQRWWITALLAVCCTFCCC